MPFWPKNVFKLLKNEEDKLFLEDMMNERKASIGAEDRVFKKREEAKISKMIKIKKRIEKEKFRQADNVHEHEKDTPDNIDCDVEYGGMEEWEPSTSRKHRRLTKTGDNIFIPFDILKNPSVVACSTRCNISNGTLSSIVNKLLSILNQPVLRDRDNKSVYGKPQFPSINGKQNASDFIHPDSCFFFRVLKLDTSFLHTSVESWEQQSSYQLNRNVVKNLEVVNDSAERGVRLAADYLTRTQIESKYQNVLHVVEKDRHLVADQRYRSQSSTRETWFLRFEENIV